jgi:threonyl-tRNA synthetase
VQADVLPVTERQNDFAREVVARLKSGGFRAEGDYRNEKLGYKVRESQLSKVPYALVVGEREAAQQLVTPRRRGGEQLPPMGVEAFLDLLRGETVNRAK